MRKTLLAAGLLLALPLPVAAQLFGGISEAQEIELGREAATMIEADLQLLDDQRVGDYVSRLGQALVARSGRAELSYAFTVVDSPEINESPDIKVGRSQRTGTTCAVSPAHLSSSNNYRLNTLRRLLAAAEQAPQPERGLRRRPSTEARKYCSGRSQKNP